MTPFLFFKKTKSYINFKILKRNDFMKKKLKREFIPIICLIIFGIISVVVAAIFLMTNRGVTIKNSTYDKQLSEIYENKEDYLGKSVEMQGYYQVIQNGDEDYHFIVQYIPFLNYSSVSNEEGGAQTGFYELDVQGLEIYSEAGKYPDENRWYTVKGILEEFTDEKNGEKYIRINLQNIKKTQKPDDILDKIYNFDPGKTIDIGVQTVTNAVKPISEEGYLSKKDNSAEHSH